MKKEVTICTEFARDINDIIMQMATGLIEIGVMTRIVEDCDAEAGYITLEFTRAEPLSDKPL
jgi:hypothetical protein